MNQSSKSFLIGIGFSLLFLIFCEYGFFSSFLVPIYVSLTIELSIYDWLYASMRESDALFSLGVMYGIYSRFMTALIFVPMMCFVIRRQNISASQYVNVFFSIIISFLISSAFYFYKNYYYLPYVGMIEYSKIQAIFAYIQILELSTLFFVIFSSVGLHVMRRLSKNKETQAKAGIITPPESGDTR